MIYYPVFLNLNDKRAVVCGGGKVAERKMLALLKSGAKVTVVSPTITRKIEREKQKGRIRHVCRQYRKGDLKNVFLVVAATDFPSVNERISRDAECLVNVVDVPDFCNFIVPSTMNRGALTIGISTSGVSPTLSMTIRKELEALYNPSFARYLKFLRKIRTQAMKSIPDKKKRRRFLKNIASEKMVDMLRKRGLYETKRFVRELFKKEAISD